MASVYSAVTVCKMTSMNSSVSVTPTLTAVSTVSTGGVYINCNNIDASKMILIIQKTATGGNTASHDRFRILDGDSKAGYSAYKLGDLKIAIASNGRATKPTAANVACGCVFVGPFETARFKDSDGHIKINATNAQNIASVGAIFI